MAATLHPSDRPVPPESGRWELYRLLSEPARLRILALVAQEELAVGELAEILGEGQPNISRHVAPLRQAGLVAVRRQGTRTLVRLADTATDDAVVADALRAGGELCKEDGSSRRVLEVVQAREAPGRAFFAKAGCEGDVEARVVDELARLAATRTYLGALSVLIPRKHLAVDAGTGDGGFLEILAPIFHKVIAFDREEAQVARCRARLAKLGQHNVEVLTGDADSDVVSERIAACGGADAVFAARLLHHAAQPAVVLRALAGHARPGAPVVVLDYERHDDESMRDMGDLWLGFERDELIRLAVEAGMVGVDVHRLPAFSVGGANATSSGPRPAGDVHLAMLVLVAQRPTIDAPIPLVESISAPMTPRLPGARAAPAANGHKPKKK